VYKKKMNNPTQIFIGLLIILVAGFVAVEIFLLSATSPFTTAQAQAIVIAEKNTDLKTPQEFGIAATDTTNYAVIGLNGAGSRVGILIPKNGGTVTEVQMTEGVAPNKLTNSNTKSVVLALYKGKPAWQVNDNNGFKIYDFKSGKVLVG
jgi:uncharacterized protein YpmB